MINRSAKRSLLWRVAETIGGEGASFAVFAMLAHTLVPGEFGSVALAVALMGVLHISLYHGWIEALITDGGQRTHDELVLAGTLGLLFSLAVAVLFALLAVPIGLALRRPDFAVVFLALLPTLPLRALCTSMLAELRLEMRFRSTALRTIAGVTIGGLIAIWTAHIGLGRWALVIQQWTVEITGFAVLLASTRRSLVTLRPSVEQGRRLMTRVMPVMLSQLASQSMRRLDLVVLGLFLADYAVGILFLVNRLIYAAQLVAQYAMADVALVVLSKSGVPKGKNAIILRDINAIGTGTGCMAFVALAVMGSELIPLVFGPKWHDAMAPVTISAIGAMFGAATGMISTTMLAAGESRSFATLNVMTATLRIVACVVGAHWWGLMGVASGAAVAGAISLLPFVRAQARMAGIGAFAISDRSIFQLLACSVLVLGWSFLRPADPRVALIVAVSLTLATVGALLFQLRTSMQGLAAAKRQATTT